MKIKNKIFQYTSLLMLAVGVLQASETEQNQHVDIALTIDKSLQTNVKKMVDSMNAELNASMTMAVIMNSKTGAIVSLTSSHSPADRVFPKNDVIGFSYEPGSVIKPITFAIAMEKGLVSPVDLIKCYNGRYQVGRKIITDLHIFDWLSAEDVIVYSSNIGIAQIGLKLSGYDFYNGLASFGFTQESTSEFPHEILSSIPSVGRLENDIYRATTAYGYGMRVNLLQLVKAYSVFNNDGIMVDPIIFDGESNYRERTEVLSLNTANEIKRILIKAVQKGTGKNAITKSLEIGGKTGTSHVVENGKYVTKYNATFVGFANDKNNKYIIGTLVVEPNKSYFASETAAVVFKKAVDIMVQLGHLKPYGAQN